MVKTDQRIPVFLNLFQWSYRCGCPAKLGVSSYARTHALEHTQTQHRRSPQPGEPAWLLAGGPTNFSSSHSGLLKSHNVRDEPATRAPAGCTREASILHGPWEKAISRHKKKQPHCLSEGLSSKNLTTFFFFLIYVTKIKPRNRGRQHDNNKTPTALWSVGHSWGEKPGMATSSAEKAVTS